MSTKDHVISYVQTFIALFLSSLGFAIMALPASSLGDIHTYTVSFFIGIITAAVRSAIKLLWQQTMPVSVGGIPRD